MRQYRASTATSGTPAPFPANIPTAATLTLSDGAVGDTTTGEAAEDIRFPSYPAASASVIAIGWDDSPDAIIAGYKITCRTDAEMAGITGAANAIRVSEAAVWTFDGTAWSALRTHTFPQDAAYHAFEGGVPAGTRRVAVVVTSYVEGGANSSGGGAYHKANASLTDFRLSGPPCAMPAPPKLSASSRFIDGVATIIIEGNKP